MAPSENPANRRRVSWEKIAPTDISYLGTPKVKVALVVNKRCHQSHSSRLCLLLVRRPLCLFAFPLPLPLPLGVLRKATVSELATMQTRAYSPLLARRLGRRSLGNQWQDKSSSSLFMGLIYYAAYKSTRLMESAPALLHRLFVSSLASLEFKCHWPHECGPTTGMTMRSMDTLERTLKYVANGRAQEIGCNRSCK